MAGTMNRPANDPDESKYQGRFGSRLRELRLSKRIEVAAVAEALDVTEKTIYQWEAGRSAPRFDQLPKLAAVLHSPIRSLFPTE
jgi:transcriptional regulator with XRE-family HTH domain